MCQLRVLCVLTAELGLARARGHRTTLAIFLRLVRWPVPASSSASSNGTMKSSIMFSHSFALIFTPVGTSCKCGVKPREVVKLPLTMKLEETVEKRKTQGTLLEIPDSLMNPAE